MIVRNAPGHHAGEVELGAQPVDIPRQHLLPITACHLDRWPTDLTCLPGSIFSSGFDNKMQKLAWCQRGRQAQRASWQRGLSLRARRVRGTDTRPASCISRQDVVTVEMLALQLLSARREVIRGALGML